MEENVALDSSKQKQFVKSIKGIKKLIQKNKDQPIAEKPATKDGKIKKRKHHEKGLVYLAHIPHGFYENQMTQYFKQFGMVTNVRVIRSKRTGKSKGYAFVEFKDPSVAQIVAETMNNYLMGKRLIKAEYIPPEKQRPAMRKKWNPLHNPGSDARLRQKKAHNALKTDKQELNRARNILGNLTEKKQKLRELGIDYDFFMPVDIPEELLSEIPSITDKDEMGSDKVGKDSKVKKPKSENVKVKTENKELSTKKSKQENMALKKEEKKPNIKQLKNIKDKKDIKEPNVNKKQQKQKEQKLKEGGVKPAENFINIQEESGDDSDSSVEFDSDEYDKLLENDDESLSEGDESDDGSEDDVSDEGDSENDLESEDDLPKKGKGKQVSLVINPNKLKKEANKKEKVPEQAKRKAPQAPPVPIVASKKSKFEKQQKSKPLVKKQFKKKK